MSRSPLEGTPPGRRREERDFDDEIEAHLAHRIDDLVADGMSQAEARDRARAEFGDAARIKAESRSARQRARSGSRASALEAALQDVGFAIRQLLHRPGFALTAIFTLVLGVATTVTITSVVDAVVLSPLPFHDPDRLVLPEMLTPSGGRFSVSEPLFVDWRTEARSFSDMAAMTGRSRTLRAPGEPRGIVVTRASHSLFDVLGVQPVIGRFFTEEEDRPAMGAALAVITNDMWRTDFAGDPGVLGSTLDLDGVRYEIVGVAPDGVGLLDNRSPVLVPMGPDPSLDRGQHDLDVVARLAPKATLQEADAELRALQERLSRTHGADLGWSTRLLAVRSQLIGDTVIRGGWIMLAAAGLLLLMACVNVSNLLMVRATARLGEMALRAALGASRGRLVRQLLTESSLLALLGGALGVLATFSVLPVIKTMGSGRIPRLATASVDGFALVVGLGAVVVATLLCGAAPVVQLRGGRLGGSIGSARGGGADPGRRLRSVLVTAQVAMTVVLLAGTGLLLRSFVALQGVDPGFEPDGTLAFRVDMPDQSWSWEERRDLVPRLREAVASAPGVTEVGATAVEPFSGLALANFVAPEDDMPDRAEGFTPIQWRVVTPGFFEAMGMELLAGRTFRDFDTWEDGTPVVIGASLAKAEWGDANPIGQRLVWGDPEGSRMTVVGVVEDLRDVELAEEPLPIVYRPHTQISWAVMTMVVRVDGDPATIVPAIRSRVQETVPGLPIGDVQSLRSNLRQAVAEPRFNLELLSGFAVMGLLLAVIGVYGVTAFDVRRRLPEIGIRLSLGARPEQVRSLILRQRLGITLVGLALGLLAAGLLSRLMGSLLYGITARDPLTWAGVVVTVAAATLVATWLPARRATRVDPRDVLNAE